MMRLAVDVAQLGRLLEGLVGYVCRSTAAVLLYRVIREALRSDLKSRRGRRMQCFWGGDQKIWGRFGCCRLKGKRDCPDFTRDDT